MKTFTTLPNRTLLLILMALVLAGYAAIRAVNLSQAVQKVKTTADTPSYVRISKESIFGAKFLANARPFIFPLILKVFRNNEETVAWAQGIFSIVSWGILAIAVAYSLQVSFLKLIALVLILLLSLYRYVIAWDSVLLTESVSLSLMTLFLAGWLWLAKGWRWHKATLISVVAFLWTFSRDTNAWVVLMIAFFLLLLVSLRQIDKKYLVLSGVFIVMFLVSNLSADLGDRWVFPFQNILGRRILPNARAVDYFANCGMPVSPSLMQLAGGYANGSDRAFYEDPALEEYRLWLDESGKACYVKWLLSSPWESIKRPFSEFDLLVSLENIQQFLFSKTFSPILPARVEAVLFPRGQLLFVFAVLLGIVLIAILTKAWMQNKIWWIIIGMNILIFPHYFITWHGDVMGIYRHVLGVSIQFYLGTWLLMLLVVDSVLSFKTVQESSINRLLMRNARQSRN
jgi:hypothetical protein